MEEPPGFVQSRGVRRQAKSAQNRDNTAGGFGNRAVFEEQRLPDSIGALGFRKPPVFFGSENRAAKELRFQIVIGQELVNPPQPKFAERWRKQVGANINNLR